ncbi:MAG TPA: PDZ domain-containing protein [Fimbriimonadaceae bacterium]|nr:PDZ domain-containing protein [Fimbriimonadaceae bacterium]
MWLSAVSVGIALLGSSGEEQTLSSAEQRVWAKVRPSVVTLMQSGVARGIGVCVDDKGSFLAHRSAVTGPNMFGKLPSGILIQLRQVAADETTQLVLVQAVTALPSPIPAVKLGNEPEKAGGTLLAVLVTGPLRAVFVNGERYGVVKPSLRLMPLNELQFEAYSAQIGGGLLFNEEGGLLGVLDATLSLGEPNPQQNVKAADTGFGGGGGGLGSLAAPPGASRIAPTGRGAAVQFGPAPQTVAYSISSSVLHRVVSGLTGPNRKVLHPAIGVLCRNLDGTGAQVASIVRGSPAEKADLRIGDIIFSIDGATIRNQVDVPRVTMRLRIGTQVEVKFRRDGEEKTVMVGVGAG